MKTLTKYIAILLFSHFSYGQTHIIHDNATSVTILPSSIQSNHIANQTALKNNLVLGNNAMGGAANNANNNTALGLSAMFNSYDGNYNVSLGHYANYWSVYSDKNVAVGYNALKSHAPISGDGVNNDDNVAVGYEALKNAYCLQNRNVAVGSQSLIGGSYNSVGIGFQSGFNSSFQMGNIFLGHQSGYSELGSHKLYIENSNSTTPLIGGDFANDIVGINRPVNVLASFPNDKLQVGGNTRVFGNLYVSGSVYATVNSFNSNITLTDGHYKMIYTGAGLHVVTLPSPLMLTGREYLIVNHGGGSIQTSLIYKTGLTSTDQFILPGNVVHLISDGSDWRKIN